MRECVGGIDSAKSKQKYQGSLLNGAGLPQAEVEQSLVTHLLFMDYPILHFMILMRTPKVETPIPQ
jgi:hypothetical protein